MADDHEASQLKRASRRLGVESRALIERSRQALDAAVEKIASSRNTIQAVWLRRMLKGRRRSQ